MTRRDGHEAVMKSMNRILDMNKVGAGMKLKINCVVHARCERTRNSTFR